MKEIPAREFRATWTRLTDEVVGVTSNGRDIGFWVPIGTEEWRWIDDALKDGNSSSESGGSEIASTDELDVSQPA